MRNINGHFTIVNEPNSARNLATKLLQSFESLRNPEHIIITKEMIESAAARAQGVKLSAFEIELAKAQDDLEKLPQINTKISHANIDKAHKVVLDATALAERASKEKNWRKLDKAKRTLSKELEKCGFETYTQYVDFLNNQGSDSKKRREILLKIEDLNFKIQQSKTTTVSKISPSQVITVVADILSRCPHTQLGPLPIVMDDAFIDLEVGSKLRALDLLKAHGARYPIWYVTADPVVLSWAGFVESASQYSKNQVTALYDMDSEVAS